MQKEIYIVKASGERVLFDDSKLIASLERSGAEQSVIESVMNKIKSELKDGATTKDIYYHAFEILKKEKRPVAAKYSLRAAIMDLGPTGFQFEKLVAEIFHAQGFKTETDVHMLGECVDHEVDVVAWNENKLIIVEAKFHNELGMKSDVKVALYVKARFDDLANTVFDYGGERKIDEGWVVTNTKFSEQAIKYAECKNMKLVGWNYPSKGNLQDLVTEAKLHPITCLESISDKDKKNLMVAGVILCKQAQENLDIVNQAGITGEKVERMLEEINQIQNS